MWTTLRQRKGGIDTVEQVDAPLELPDEVQDLRDPAALAQIKARCGRLKGRLFTALPTDQAILRVAFIPATDPAELRSMVELQVDKIAPYPLDQMVITHEILAREETGCRVLIAAAQRAVLDGIGDICFKTGLYPHAIDLAVMGRWWLLKNRGHIADAGRQILLILDGQTADVIVVQAGMPMLIRSLGRPDPARPLESARELADELKYTLVALEIESGAGVIDGVTAWHTPDLGTDFLAAMGHAIGSHWHTRALSELPPVTEGLAHRALERTGDMLDLAPQDWKDSMQARKSRGRLLAIGGTVLGLWLLGIGSVVVYAQMEGTDFTGLKNRVKAQESTAKSAMGVREQAESLQRYADRSRSALESLREICTVLPPGVELTSFRYEKFKAVTVVGYGTAYEPIQQFRDGLNTSALFKGIESEDIKQENTGTGIRQKLTVSVKLPPSESDKGKPNP